MIELYQEIWNRRKLIATMVDGQIRASVQSTWLGKVWYTLIPLTQISIYYFLIVVVLKGGAYSNKGAFLIILIGLMHYLCISHIGSYALSSIYNNASLLLQVKLEPIVLIAAGYYRAIRLSLHYIFIALLGYFLLGEEPTTRLLLYPVIVFCWLVLLWSLSIFLAASAVFIRDLERLFPIFSEVCMYLSAVIYTVNFYPKKYFSILLLNPIACIFSLLQWCFLGAECDPFQPLMVLGITVPISLMLAHSFYLKTCHNFTKAF